MKRVAGAILSSVPPWASAPKTHIKLALLPKRLTLSRQHFGQIRWCLSLLVFERIHVVARTSFFWLDSVGGTLLLNSLSIRI